MHVKLTIEKCVDNELSVLLHQVVQVSKDATVLRRSCQLVHVDYYEEQFVYHML
jgi:hypothetical protein